MDDPRTLRHRLRESGYCPIPLFGKEPPQYGKNNRRKGLDGWQQLHEVTREMIDMWSRTWPDAHNTGVLCRTMPTLDIDIVNEAAVRTIEDHVREHYEEHGYILPRVGKPPKRAIPFRTIEPFKKITVNLVAANSPDKSEKIEFLADGQQVVVAGIHPDTKQPYCWHGGVPGEIKLEDLPYIREEEARALVERIVEILVRDFGYNRAPGRPAKGKTSGAPRHDGGQAGGESDWTHLYENIREGRELHDTITVLAAKLIACGNNPGAAINQLRGLMETSKAPQDERWDMRVSGIPAAVDSAVAKYGKSEDRTVSPPDLKAILAATEASDITAFITGSPIDDAVKVYDRWLILNDHAPIYALLGTIAANLLPGAPVWLGIIAPPSSAKTELLNSISGLPHVIQVATITPAALLSGTPKKQHETGARGGLLQQIGSFGILCLKDFGSILSMHAESRAETMAALREVYDGEWTRHLGTAGGKSLTWKGKLALIFASTEVFDSHHAVIGAMGDRFLMSRLKPVAGRRQFGRALKHAGGSIGQMRKELSETVAKLFANRREPAAIDGKEVKAIGDAVALAVRLRGAVARDFRSREIEAVYGAEGTARIGLALERLLAGLDSLGMDRTGALKIVTEVALDSVPPLRRQAYDWIYDNDEKGKFIKTKEVATNLGLPTTTAKRILEDLAAHGLVKRKSDGQGKADLWKRTDWREREAEEEAKYAAAEAEREDKRVG
jgi:hypothetical protein